LKNSWATRMLANARVFLVLIFALSFLGCLAPKRSEINASIWLNNAPLPEELCQTHKELNDYGFYRKLNDGNLEFISFCNKDAAQWLSMHQSDFEKLMDKYVPERRGQ